MLTEAGFYFVDEIIWIKPEPSVSARIGGYRRTRNPLSYKPNCITESLMVYLRNCNFLLDAFAGSGTTGRAALKMKRIPILCEIKEEYVKRIREEMPDV